jgi:EAL domain-containing protein (putative c-di-GMP-specific phosphodiesterase class I)
MVVVAEGIETSDQLERMREMGCVLAQGYFLARPCEPEQIEQMLAAVAPTQNGHPSPSTVVAR